MLGWFWELRPDEPEPDADDDAGPPGVERPAPDAAAAAGLPSGTLRRPSRSAECAGPCSSGGGGGRPGEGVKSAPLPPALDGGLRGPVEAAPLM